jgi:mRNA turnover protein 4
MSSDTCLALPWRQVALGKTEADEYKAGLAELSSLVRGTVGLFFTNLPHEEVRCGGAP